MPKKTPKPRGISFGRYDPERRKHIAYMGGITKRSPEIRRAWEMQDTLIALYRSGTPIRELVENYHVPYRTLYRIIRVK